MDKREKDSIAVCSRIIELTHVLDRRDVDTLLEELDATLSQFEAELGEPAPDITESHTEELEAVARGLAQRDTDAVPQQVDEDIDTMQDIVDGMSDSE